MKSWKSLGIFAISFPIFYYLSISLPVIDVPIAIVSMTLTFIGLLFGLLASFFISELWNRHVNMREVMAGHSSTLSSILGYVDLFNHNIKFKQNMKHAIEKYITANVAVRVIESERTDKYFMNLYKALDAVSIDRDKDNTLLTRICALLNDLSNYREKMTIIGKENLFVTEWALLGALSVVIVITTFMQRTGDSASLMLSTIFPPLVILTLSIVYELNKLSWNENSIFIEPDEKIFDRLGMSRLYMTSDIKLGRISPSALPKHYRTEKDLHGELKEIYLDVINPEHYPHQEDTP
jgi:hypothetical protein